MNKYERWTDEEWARTEQLLLEHDKKVVSHMIGRSLACLVEKIRWQRMTPEGREARRVAVKTRRWAVQAGAVEKRVRRTHATPAVVVSARPDLCFKAVADRDLRNALSPRTITAAFFNDPLPGYSALDRREQRA